ncbi:MAG: hypothetical protein IPN46_06835 [Saprospiraceae bacterium]|nr:hypothetical protein [Saprospiraceae bacterium]
MQKDHKVYLSDLHFEHTQWLSELKFWEDEIKSFSKRLGEVVVRYTSNEIRAKIEHFQNQFILHDEVIDLLKKDVKNHEKAIALQAEDNPVAINHVYFNDHTGLRDKMDTQRQIYRELKSTYYNFLSKSM